MKFLHLLNINVNGIYPKFGFRIIISSCGFGEKLSEITLNFDPGQYFWPYLEMKFSCKPNVEVNRLFPNFGFGIIILTCGFRGETLKNYHKFSVIQIFQLYIQNGLLDLNGIFTVA